MLELTEDQFNRIKITHLHEDPVVPRVEIKNAAEKGYKTYCLHGLEAAQKASPWDDDNYVLHKAYCRGIRAAWRQEGLDRALKDL